MNHNALMKYKTNLIMRSEPRGTLKNEPHWSERRGRSGNAFRNCTPKDSGWLMRTNYLLISACCFFCCQTLISKSSVRLPVSEALCMWMSPFSFMDILLTLRLLGREPRMLLRSMRIWCCWDRRDLVPALTRSIDSPLTIRCWLESL